MLKSVHNFTILTVHNTHDCESISSPRQKFEGYRSFKPAPQNKITKRVNISLSILAAVRKVVKPYDPSMLQSVNVQKEYEFKAIAWWKQLQMKSNSI